MNPPTKRTSIPDTWLGYWKDNNNKQLLIEKDSKGAYRVSVFDENGKPYRKFLIEQSTKKPATFAMNSDGLPVLQAEGGVFGVGPTYRLLFLCLDKVDKLRLANDDDPLE